MPLIILTHRADELARVRYLDRGGDDVVSKPFCYAELRARIGALLRRSQLRNGGRVTRVGALRIDHAARDVRIGERRSSCRPRNTRCCAPRGRTGARVHQAAAAARRMGVPVPRPHANARQPRLPPAQRKLAQAGGGRWIENVWGVGYRLAPLDAQTPRDTAA